MISSLIKAGNTLIRYISGLMAAVLLVYGLFSIAGSFRQEARAGSSEDLIRFETGEEEHSVPDMDELISVNPDITGWLRIYGTKIDYPVLQGRTDMEYINKDVYGDYSVSGSIFLSSLNNRDYSGTYQLIYGHHMENGTMFGDIDKFSDEDCFCNRNGERPRDRDGYLVSEGKISDLQIFSVVKTDAFDSMIYEADKTEEETEKLILYAKENSEYYRDVGDIGHVIALSTCDSGFSYGRTVLLLKVRDHMDSVEDSLKLRSGTKVKRAAAYPERRSFAVMDVIILLLELYLAVPVRLIRQADIMGQQLLNILCLLSCAVTYGIFLFSEDILGKAVITGVMSPLMIMMLTVTWLLRYRIFKKCKS